MCRTATRSLILRSLPGLLAIALGMLIVVAVPRAASAQRISLEVDQKALGKLFAKQIGKRWVLVSWRGSARLVLEKPQLSITPLGIYVAGTLKSTTPSFSTEVEVRVRPRIKGARIEVVPSSVLVTRPSGVWGMIPRQILTRWLKSSAGASWLTQARIDLSPLLALLGKGKPPKIKLKLGFGRLTLVVQL